MKMRRLLQVLCLGLLLQAFLQGKGLVNGLFIHLVAMLECSYSGTATPNSITSQCSSSPVFNSIYGQSTE